MRELSLRNREDKRQKRNQMIVGLILVFVMFSSVLGFAFTSFSYTGENNADNSQQNSMNYNGFEFIEQNGFWNLNKDGINYIFSYNPNQVPRINSEIKDLENYQDNILYLQSRDVIVKSEIKVNLLQFTNGIENIEESVENINCEFNSIIIKEGERTITQDNNCVFIEGNSEELLQLTDEFLFKLLLE
jgi:hypothetical protein